MLYYTILKLKPDIIDSSEQLLNDIVNSDFIKTNLKLKNLYKNYINEKVVFILGNLGFIWYKCSKEHFYCGENNALIKNEEIKCLVCLLQGKNIKKFKKLLPTWIYNGKFSVKLIIGLCTKIKVPNLDP